MYFTEYLYYRIYWILKQAIFNYDKNADSFSSVFSDFFKSKKARNTVSDEVKNLFGSVDLDGSLFDALSGKTIKDANFNNWINGLENSEGGTSLTGIKTALTNFFKKKVKVRYFLHTQNWISNGFKILYISFRQI